MNNDQIKADNAQYLWHPMAHPGAMKKATPDIIAKGYEAEVVEKVIRLVDRNEYKRCQGAIGPRISSRAFSRERRYPIVNGWTAND